MAFYEQLADDYDALTGEAGRVDAARAFLAELLRRHGVQTAIDVACGTGLHAVMLAEMGVAVTASDLSGEMLAAARRRAEAAGVDIAFHHAAMQDVADVADGPFDAVLCLGNSLPHLLEPDALARTAEGFARLASGGGVAVVQLLNYARVLARRERIVGVTRSAGAEFVRFYDFLEAGLLRFNVLTLRWAPDGCEHELAETLLRPWLPGELTAVFGAAGFAEVGLHAGLGFGAFDETDSDVLLLVGRTT